ncbi:hypothetical protein DFH06DRAFT_1445770 [Mycena polygramma]|nr:hypothetical protein DFH06DRAFT_1445770 [Mycena polygramma]
MHDDPYFWFNVARHNAENAGACPELAVRLARSSKYPLIPPDITPQKLQKSSPAKRITGAHDGADDQLRTICRSASTATEAQLAQSHEKWMGKIWKSRADEMPSFPRLNEKKTPIKIVRERKNVAPSQQAVEHKKKRFTVSFTAKKHHAAINEEYESDDSDRVKRSLRAPTGFRVTSASVTSSSRTPGDENNCMLVALREANQHSFDLQRKRSKPRRNASEPHHTRGG